jgi:tRNA(Ile)-lysidine synthase
VEAWARRERYRALAEMAHEARCSLVLLAHHRQDQAETWLLQALRGAGPRGLSGMPRLACRDGITWARPWLDQPREIIERYARRHRLRHVDDSSNDDPAFARNALRLRVWPALIRAFPDAEVVLTAAAGHAQEAAALAAEVAAFDLPAVSDDAALRVPAWQALPPARKRNVLAAWLSRALGVAAPSSLVSRLLEEMPRSRSARWPAPGGALQLHRGRLMVQKASECGRVGKPGPPAVLDLGQPGCVAAPGWCGHFIVEPAQSGGALPHLLRAAQLRARTGGERFRFGPRSAARSLKKQYQAQGIPAWERDGPLLFSPEGQILFAPGLGINGAAQAPVGEVQLRLRWQADSESGGADE